MFWNGRVLLPIVSGDTRAGNAFLPPVHTLVVETLPIVSEPPGNPAGFQARAELPSRVEKPLADFQRFVLM
jgi:hypothetical protein